MQLAVEQELALSKAGRSWFVDRLVGVVSVREPSIDKDELRDHVLRLFDEDDSFLAAVPHQLAIWACCSFVQLRRGKPFNEAQFEQADLFTVAADSGLDYSLLKSLYDEFGRLQSVGVPICSPVLHSFGYESWCLRSSLSRLPVDHHVVHGLSLQNGRWSLLTEQLDLSVSCGFWPVGYVPTLAGLGDEHTFTHLQLLFEGKSLQLQGIGAFNVVLQDWLRRLENSQAKRDPVRLICGSMNVLTSESSQGAISEPFWHIQIQDLSSRFLQVRWRKGTEGFVEAESRVEVVKGQKPPRVLFSKSKQSTFKWAESHSAIVKESRIFEDRSDHLGGGLSASWRWFNDDLSNLKSASWKLQALLDLKLQACSFELNVRVLQGALSAFYSFVPILPQAWCEELDISLPDLSAVESGPMELGVLTGPVVARCNNQNDPAGGLQVPAGKQVGQWVLSLSLAYLPEVCKFQFLLAFKLSDLVLDIRTTCPWSGVAYQSHLLAPSQTLWNWGLND